MGAQAADLATYGYALGLLAYGVFAVVVLRADIRRRDFSAPSRAFTGAVLASALWSAFALADQFAPVAGPSLLSAGFDLARYALWLAFLITALRPGLGVDRALVTGVLLFLAAIGATFPGIQRNFFIGVRVPWTIASQRVWDDTHALAGRIWVAGGLLGALLAAAGQTLVAFVLVVPMAVVPIVYSFLRYKHLERIGGL